MSRDSYPRICFEYPFDEQVAFEARARGYWGHSKVELEDGSMHSVVFYDAVRLSQDLEEESSNGRPFIGEKGMIVLEDVTLENMKIAVKELTENGFFD